MRVFLIVLDSVGAGELPDADKYGDVGANTLAHVIETENPKLPNLARMGLGYIDTIPLDRPQDAKGAAGRAQEKSPGKDTTTGHWEMAGIRLQKPFPTYPHGFPPEVIAAFEKAIGRKTLGNYAASGTVIIEDLGEEHLRTGYPIVYTSADSVFQIACNEEIIPLETLYAWCEIARKMLHGDHNAGRVIARPFVGRHKGGFTRTKGRRDFSVVPPEPTILDALLDAGFFTMGIGKIEDIFAEKGLRESVHSAGNTACIAEWLKMMQRDFDGLTFINLVDFDMLYGHRRDTKAYAQALEEFDEKLGEAQAMARTDDVFIITADHGCDPTFRGTDHTREHAPVLVWTKKMQRFIPLGTRESFADIAATIADLFGLPQRFDASSFADIIR
ncbi:MAG: phosphopentomutase [Firmicutes bacterium]|nr:phosphopentomutase [Bacillota bacterium]